MTSTISFYVQLCRMGRRERPGCNYLLPSATMGEYEEPVSGLSHSDVLKIVPIKIRSKHKNAIADKQW